MLFEMRRGVGRVAGACGEAGAVVMLQLSGREDVAGQAGVNQEILGVSGSKLDASSGAGSGTDCTSMPMWPL